MDILKSIILGVIQGVTEFLPISSTGHLIIFHDLLNFSMIDDLNFDVAMHLGTLSSLLIFFSKDLSKYIIAFFRSITKQKNFSDLDQKLAWLIILGAIPAGLAGWLFEDIVEQYLRSSWVVALSLIVVGIIFLIVEKDDKKNKDLSQLKLVNAVLIGLAQAVALIPGVSRSGITIAAGLNQKFKREEAAKFSFLIAIPVIFGAGFKKMLELSNIELSINEIIILLIGFLTALVSGYFSIKYLLKYLKYHSLNIFAYYRFFIGSIIIILLALKILSY